MFLARTENNTILILKEICHTILILRSKHHQQQINV